jgi:hypothetical protein
MPMPTPRVSAEEPLHPLYRLYIEAPEQLEPCLRRAVLRMVRRRLAGWLRATLSTGMRDLGQFCKNHRQASAGPSM